VHENTMTRPTLVCAQQAARRFLWLLMAADRRLHHRDAARSLA
jgi:hypothetical protein